MQKTELWISSTFSRSLPKLYQSRANWRPILFFIHQQLKARNTDTTARKFLQNMCSSSKTRKTVSFQQKGHLPKNQYFQSSWGMVKNRNRENHARNVGSSVITAFTTSALSFSRWEKFANYLKADRQENHTVTNSGNAASKRLCNKYNYFRISLR